MASLFDFRYDLFKSSISVSILTLVILLYRYCKQTQRGKTLPPGPPTYPFLGNLPSLPVGGLYHKLYEWGKIYGPIMSLKLGPKTVIVIQDPHAVRDLLDKKSLIYSSRPPSYIASELVSDNMHPLLMPYGKGWQKMRKAMHQSYTSSVCDAEYLPIIHAEQVHMLADFLVSPQKFLQHPRRYACSLAMCTIYGRRGEHYAGEVIKIFDVMEDFVGIQELGAAPPVDIYPFLRYLPQRLFSSVKPWRSWSTELNHNMRDLYSGLIAEVRARRASGIIRNSLCDRVLNAQDSWQFTDTQLNFLHGVLLEGASDTTAGTLQILFQVLAVFPAEQKKVQDEIDQHFDVDRMPTYENAIGVLPYTLCFMKELIRWRCVISIAPPHYLTEEDSYQGYIFPKNSTVLLATYGLHCNEAKYPDPFAFKPSRFENYTKLATEYINSTDRDHYAYGAGRRICAGIQLAERSVFSSIAKILWAFNVEHAVDGNGIQIPIDTSPSGFGAGINTIPKPFQCRIIPRSEAKVQTIKDELREAQQNVFPKYSKFPVS